MSNVKHTVILASAGSGKTFRLAHHFIHLLIHKVPVERVLALTFSRKASGEITDSIVTYLHEAATNDTKATTIATRLQHPELTRADFTRILSNLLAHIHRLGTSTLDSFLINILQAFPFELGLPPTVRFMENGSFEATNLRSATLAGILDPYGLSENDRHSFMAAFHHSIGGRTDATVTSLLEMFIETGLATHETMPDAHSWGNASVVWTPSDLHHIMARPASLDEASQWAQELVGELTQQSGLNKQLFKSLVNLANDCALYSAESSTVPNQLETNAASAVAAWVFGTTAASPLQIAYRNNTHTFSARVTELFRKLLTRVLHTELQKGIARTKGLHHVLSAYATAYATSIKQSGLMTFSDAQHILAAHSDSDSRLDIDYRLDGRIDHWLLDEFQDTSDPQWKGLSHLIDEVIEDSTHTRTFFMVGDVKQAIHGWRGGNPHLAQAIVERYGITAEPMGESFRSCADIIHIVNTCFGHLSDPALPKDAIARWNQQWEEHSTHISAPGYACLLETKDSKQRADEEEDDSPLRYHAVADILQKLDPVNNGLSVAILTRSNLEGGRIANFLRKEAPGIPVSLEGVAPFIDNLVAETLLALIGFSLHPSDTVLWQFIQMTPLAGYLREKQLDQQSLPLAILREIHDQGYASFLRHWGTIMDENRMLDDFGRSVVSHMVLVADDFLGTGQSIEHFVPFLKGSKWTPSSHPGGVSILTIHRSKGLGFDAVILPQLDTQGHYLDRANLDGILIHRDPNGDDLPWRLDIPPRNWAELDPTLRKHIAQQDALSCYDSLCVLYVAMTRAKRGLYMIVPEESEKEARGVKVSDFLRTRLKPSAPPTPRSSDHVSYVYEIGDSAWAAISGVSPIPGIAQPPLTSSVAKTESKQRRLELMEPSKTADHATSLSWLFHEKHRDVLAFGSAIHELLAQVEWIETVDAEAVVRNWLPLASCNDAVRADVLARFHTCLKSGSIRTAMSKPRGQSELWREKPFELILKDQRDNRDKLVRGVFDRVVIHSTGGDAVSAIILDFKSDRINADEVKERCDLHKGQMDLYRKALAKILHIPESAITCQLLFIVPAVVAEV